MNVGLGEDKAIDVKLELASLTEAVTVTAQVPLIDTVRAGTASNVRAEMVETLPTVSRSLADFARLAIQIS